MAIQSDLIRIRRAPKNISYSPEIRASTGDPCPRPLFFETNATAPKVSASRAISLASTRLGTSRATSLPSSN